MACFMIRCVQYPKLGLPYRTRHEAVIVLQLIMNYKLLLLHDALCLPQPKPNCGLTFRFIFKTCKDECYIQETAPKLNRLFWFQTKCNYLLVSYLNKFDYFWGFVIPYSKVIRHKFTTLWNDYKQTNYHPFQTYYTTCNQLSSDYN